MKKLFHIFLFIFAFILSSCFGTHTEIITINIVEFDPESKKNGVLIDVRTPDEFADGHLPYAINIDVKNENFKESINEIKKNNPVYLYCKSGMRSAKAVKILDSLGFEKIYNLDGGFLAWSEASKTIRK